MVETGETSAPKLLKMKRKDKAPDVKETAARMTKMKGKAPKAPKMPGGDANIIYSRTGLEKLQFMVGPQDRTFEEYDGM